jgi:hypothetical protein
MNTNINTQNSISKTNEKKYFSLQASMNDFSFYTEMTKLQAQTENNIPKQEDLPKEKEENIKEAKDVIEEDGLLMLSINTNAQPQNVNTDIFNIYDTEEITQMKNRNNTLRIDLAELTLDDIKLFDSLSQNNDTQIANLDVTTPSANIAINNGNGIFTYKTFEISKTIMNAIETAAKTNKPLRLDFGQDASVILRIGKDGKLSADFIPNDKAMETILKNALPELRAKFEEENIPYNQLNYKNPYQNKENNQNSNKEKENKENE